MLITKRSRRRDEFEFKTRDSKRWRSLRFTINVRTTWPTQDSQCLVNGNN